MVAFQESRSGQQTTCLAASANRNDFDNPAGFGHGGDFNNSGNGPKLACLGADTGLPVLAVHLLAMLAVALSGAPASPLEQRFSSLFSPYIDALDQGHVHRYYAPAPPPTPIALAELRFGEGKPPRNLRIPDRAVRPRMRYQRQLALAYHLFEELQARARVAQERPPFDSSDRLAASYARHLAADHPGCVEVVLRLQQHLIPDLVRLREMTPAGSPLPDSEDDRFYTVPQLIGTFPVQP